MDSSSSKRNRGTRIVDTKKLCGSDSVESVVFTRHDTSGSHSKDVLELYLERLRLGLCIWLGLFI